MIRAVRRGLRPSTREAGSDSADPHPTTTRSEAITVYDMYPEWGPTARDTEHPAHPARESKPVQESIDRRENGGQRPDDN